MALLNTTTVRDSSFGLVKTTEIYKETAAAASQASIFYCLGAKSVTIVSSALALVLKIPHVDSNGDPTAQESAVVTSDLHKSPSSTKAGFISESVMPPFFTMDNTNVSTPTDLYVYIRY